MPYSRIWFFLMSLVSSTVFVGCHMVRGLQDPPPPPNDIVQAEEPQVEEDLPSPQKRPDTDPLCNGGLTETKVPLGCKLILNGEDLNCVYKDKYRDLSRNYEYIVSPPKNLDEEEKFSCEDFRKEAEALGYPSIIGVTYAELIPYYEDMNRHDKLGCLRYIVEEIVQNIRGYNDTSNVVGESRLAVGNGKFVSETSAYFPRDIKSAYEREKKYLQGFCIIDLDYIKNDKK